MHEVMYFRRCEPPMNPLYAPPPPILKRPETPLDTSAANACIVQIAEWLEVDQECPEQHGP